MFRIEESFNFAEPNYIPIFQARFERLKKIREKPKETMPALRRVYQNEPWRFIEDWGMTVDPRNVERNLPAAVPFILFPRQREWCQWLVERWKNQESAVTPKSRDIGVSWLTVAMAVSLCLFHHGMSIGFGSRKEEYVDKIGSPKALFWKARKFIETIPVEFRANYDPKSCAPHLRLLFPATDSCITGEAGDNIGRGDRQSIYFVDEAAFLMRPQLIEASLSATTNCRIDVSSANGMANPFADKVHKYPPNRVFTLHWRDDPRKDDAWYAKQIDTLDPVTVAQEIDINFSASVEGVIIPSEWVQAALDAHDALGIAVDGERLAALDIADEGVDMNALAARTGCLLNHIEEWSGSGGDIYQTVVRTFSIADNIGVRRIVYDTDGLGAGARGDARTINDTRGRQSLVQWDAFRGSGAVIDPKKRISPNADRTNEDYYKNIKAQSWARLREMFRSTWRARNDPDYKFDPGNIISISSTIAPRIRNKLMIELSQPTWGPDNNGKMIVNKKPDGTRSPNLADSVMMLFGNPKRGLVISEETVRKWRG